MTIRLRTKVLLLLALTALGPLLVSYAVTDRVVAQAFREEVDSRVLLDASQIAGRIDDRLNWMLEAISISVLAIPFENFPSDQLVRAMMIPYRQLSNANVIALLDLDGNAVVPPYRPSQADAGLFERAYVTDSELARFANSVPLQGALDASFAIGPVYLADNGDPRMVVAVSVPAPDGRWIVAVGLSLSDLCRVGIEETSTDYRSSVLLESRGYPVCGQTKADKWRQVSDYAHLRALKRERVLAYDTEGQQYSVVNVHVPTADWTLIHKRNRSAAMDMYNARIRKYIGTWIGICLILAIGGAVFFSRGITAPVERLAAATNRIAKGDYDEPLDVVSKDELGELSNNFNLMTREIKGWHTELSKRVQQQTRELRLAQEQIIQTQKLAALGELGAGVAHEINNPLTVVIGNAQLLLEEMEGNRYHRELLLEMVTHSRRVAEIVDSLLRFSQRQWGETMQPLNVINLLNHAVDFYIERLKEKSMEVMWRDRCPVSVFGISRDLQLVFVSILDNSIKFSEPNTRLFFDVRQIDGGAVLVSIEDEGCGMSEETRIKAMDPFFSTDAESGSKGIGLTTVMRIVDEHKGKISIESELGKGTTVSVFFPGDVGISKGEHTS